MLARQDTLGPFLLHLRGSDVGHPSLLDIPPSPDQAPEYETKNSTLLDGNVSSCLVCW